MPAVDPAAMRRLNSRLTLAHLFRADGAVTMTQLVERTGLSRRTIELILTDLTAEGWVREVEPDGVRGVGRPPKAYEFRTEHALIGAIQVDTYQARAIVADLRGEILVRRSVPLADQYDAVPTMHTSMDLLAEVIEEAGATGRIRVVAFAGGGVFDSEGNVHHLVNTRTWSGLRPVEMLSERFGVPALADNDANLAALAERWQGAAQDFSSFTWLLPGMRNGAGIIIDDRIHRGFLGGAGEIVHVGAMGLIDLEHHPFGALTSPFPADFEKAAELAQAAHEGDAEALAAIESYVAPIVTVISMFCWTIAPPLILLGGGSTLIGDLLIPRIETAMREADMPPVTIRMAALPWDGPLLGAVIAARSHVGGDLAGAFSDTV